MNAERLGIQQESRHEHQSRVQRREQQRDRQRDREAPPDADARDEKDVQDEERRRAALGEERDRDDPREIGGRREVPETLLPKVLATDDPEEEHAPQQVRGEHEVPDLRRVGWLLRVDDRDRHRRRRHQHAAEGDDLLVVRDSHQRGAARAQFRRQDGSHRRTAPTWYCAVLQRMCHAATGRIRVHGTFIVAKTHETGESARSPSLLSENDRAASPSRESMANEAE